MNVTKVYQVERKHSSNGMFMFCTVLMCTVTIYLILLFACKTLKSTTTSSPRTNAEKCFTCKALIKTC